jgi:hypothetical protein
MPTLEAVQAELARRRSGGAPAAPKAAPGGKASLASMAPDSGMPADLGSRLGQNAETAKQFATTHAAPLGGTIGGIVGSPLGIPGAAVGAGLGGAYGEAYRRAQEGKPLGNEILKEGLAQGAYEVFGGLVVKGANKVVKSVAGRAVHGAVEADAILRSAAVEVRDELIQAGHPAEAVDALVIAGLTSAQATKGKFLDTLETFAKGTVTSSRMTDLAETQEALFREIPSVIARKFGPMLDKESVARMTVNRFKELQEVGKGRIGGMYDVIGKRMGTHTTIGSRSPTGPTRELLTVTETGTNAGLVNLKPARRALIRQQKALQELGNINPDPEGVNTLVDVIRSLPDEVSFDTAKQLRTDIQDLARKVKLKDDKAQFVSAATEVDKVLTGAMDEAVVSFDKAVAKKRADDIRFGRAVGPTRQPVKPLLDMAEKFTADFHNRANHEMVRGFVALADEKFAGPQVLDELIRDQGAERVGKIINGVLGKDSREANMIRSWHLRKLWDESMVGGTPQGAKFLEAVESETRQIGPSAMRALHGLDNLNNYKAFARATEVAQRKGTTSGSEFIRFAEWATLGTALLTMGNPAVPALGRKTAAVAGGSWVISMKALNRLLASPKTARWLIDAQKFGPKSRAGLAAAQRVVASLGTEEAVRIPERPKAEDYKNIRLQMERQDGPRD